jgi:hypothetical protein
MKNQVGTVVVWILAVMVGGCAVGSTEDVASAADPVEPEVAVTEQHLADQCGHSICETGAAVSATCDSCVVSICAADSFCCTTSWDGQCVGEVSSICHLGPVALTSSTVVSSINVRMNTGGDDLRDGSQAVGAFQITGGGVLPAVSLNGGAGFAGGSIHNATIPLSPARTLGSLTGFTLTWDGAPRRLFDTYDNWNADQFLFFITPGGAGRCPNFLGAPIFPGRMTGARTVFSSAIHFP